MVQETGQIDWTGAPELDVELLDVNEYSRPGTTLKQVNGIVIHYTANPGSSAMANRDYFEGLKDAHTTKASSHFQYVNGELDVDRIINKAKRKRMASYDISKAELIAPAASHRFDYYNNNQKLKVCDYSSCNPEREKLVYAMVIPEKEGLLKVLFEPSEHMVKDFRLKAPRKVFFD